MQEEPQGLDRYEMNRIITKTLQGRLYKGRDRIDDKPVGVKEAFKVLIASGRSRDGSPVSEHFPTETRIHAQISSHADLPRSILRMLDQWETDDSQFVALEWAEGGEMFDYVKDAMTSSAREIASLATQEQLPAQSLNQWQEAAKNIFKQLIEGVAWLHSKGYSHRDLSLENTLMANRKNTRIKIIDFGVAQEYPDGDFSCPAGRVGKLGYMAPEVYAKQPYDARDADIWSLGVMLFMLLVGCPPYSTPRASDQAFSFIFRGELQFVLRHWRRLPMVPHDALDLMERIFKPASHRIKMEEIWAHPWVNIPDPFPKSFSEYATEEAAQLFRQVSQSHTSEELCRIQREVEEKINELQVQLEAEQLQSSETRQSVVERPTSAMAPSPVPDSFLRTKLNDLNNLHGVIRSKMSSMFSRFGRTPNGRSGSGANT